MKIYTRKGDQGTTGLLGGTRLEKDDIRIEAYGTIDELNAFLGHLADQVDSIHRPQLRDLQNQLFNIGSYLANLPNSKFNIPPPESKNILRLEQAIDQMEEDLPPLRNFVLPAGHPLVSAAHICRTICRRAERRVVTLSHQDEVAPSLLQFLNRLSDYFFVLARKLAQENEVDEIVWTST